VHSASQCGEVWENGEGESRDGKRRRGRTREIRVEREFKDSNGGRKGMNRTCFAITQEVHDVACHGMQI
jgi:hypothetical protein